MRLSAAITVKVIFTPTQMALYKTLIQLSVQTGMAKSMPNGICSGPPVSEMWLPKGWWWLQDQLLQKYQRIDLEALSMTTCNKCVIYQDLFASRPTQAPSN